jgi:predicted nucleotidyltransferase
MHYYQFQSRLFREIKSTQLSGLLYFNQAVVAYNKREWEQCVYHLEKARSIYDNARISELTHLLVETISQADLNEKSKQELLIHLSPFVTDLPVLAGR